jgi:hypothetical protein
MALLTMEADGFDGGFAESRFPLSFSWIYAALPPASMCSLSALE